LKKLLDGQLLADYTKNMPTTKTAEMLTNRHLLDNARFVLKTFTNRGGSLKSFTGDVMKGWREDVTKALTQCARCHRRMLGSFDRTQPLTFAVATGFTAEAVAAVLLINAGETL
jgi:hypothetical protein